MHKYLVVSFYFGVGTDAELESVRHTVTGSDPSRGDCTYHLSRRERRPEGFDFDGVAFAIASCVLSPGIGGKMIEVDRPDVIQASLESLGHC